MDNYNATEQAYKNGYEKGSKDTAEKILEEGRYCMPIRLKEWIIKQFGVEMKES